MKKRKIVRFACLLLTLACIFSLFSCGADLSDEDAKDRAAELLQKSVLINRIYFGSGIPADPTVIGDAAYKKADPAFLEAHGFQSVEQLKKKTLEVYTSYCAEDIFFNIFTAVVGVSDSRARYRDDSGTLYVDTKAEVLYADRVEFDTDSIRITKSKKNVIYFTVDMTVYNADESKSQTLSAQSFSLREENGVWLLDTPTYAVYYDER